MGKAVSKSVVEPGIFGVSYAQNHSAVPMAQAAIPRHDVPELGGPMSSEDISRQALRVARAKKAAKIKAVPTTVIEPMTTVQFKKAKARGVPGTAAWDRGRSVGVAGPMVAEDLYLTGVRAGTKPTKTRPSGTGIDNWKGQRVAVQLPGSQIVTSIGMDAFAAANAAEEAEASAGGGATGFYPSAAAVEDAIATPDPRFEQLVPATVAVAPVEPEGFVAKTVAMAKAHPVVATGVAIVAAKLLGLF